MRKPWREPNPDHPRGKGGRFVHKGGGADAFVQRVSDQIGKAVHTPGTERVTRGLRAGKEVVAPPPPIGDLMVSLAAQDAVNLAKLSVRGPGNKNLFTNHIREIPRHEMPQLPTNVKELEAFAGRLAIAGVGVRLMKADPRKLKMTQNQLDSKKVGKLYGYMRDGGWQEGGVIIVSREGAVLDGHHRWAGASALAASREEGFQIDVLRIDMPIDDLLKIANEVSGPRKGLGEEN